MTWPQRGTRKIVVDSEEHLWHYDACCTLCSKDVITAGKPNARYFLFIDPLTWGFEFRPRSVAEAIRWARKSGWSAESGPTRAMALNDATHEFEWLEPGQRHLNCRKEGA